MADTGGRAAPFLVAVSWARTCLDPFDVVCDGNAGSRPANAGRNRPGQNQDSGGYSPAERSADLHKGS